MARERSGVTFRAPRLRTLAGSVRSDRPTQRDEALPVRARPGTGLLVVAPPRHERERRFLNLDLVRDLNLNLDLNLDLEWTWTWTRFWTRPVRPERSAAAGGAKSKGGAWTRGERGPRFYRRAA